ncbi:MAG: GNAT family N-acetyltransferase [Pseudomonadota bacterium]
MSGPARRIVECADAATDAATWPVMAQLRPHIPQADYPAALSRVRAEGARLIAAFEGERCVGAAVYRFNKRLAMGPIVYVDDLVTDQAARSTGVGEALLSWIEEAGRNAGAGWCVLDSSVQRAAAHRFYFRNRYDIAAFCFKKRL